VRWKILRLTANFAPMIPYRFCTVCDEMVQRKAEDNAYERLKLKSSKHYNFDEFNTIF